MRRFRSSVFCGRQELPLPQILSFFIFKISSKTLTLSHVLTSPSPHRPDTFTPDCINNTIFFFFNIPDITLKFNLVTFEFVHLIIIRSVRPAQFLQQFRIHLGNVASFWQELCVFKPLTLTSNYCLSCYITY